MPTKTPNFRTIVLIVHMGGQSTRKFEVRASQSETAMPQPPNDPDGNGAGGQDAAFLSSILTKINNAYSNDMPITFCVDANNSIVPDQNCPP